MPASIFNGTSVKALKDVFSINDRIKITTNDSDDPRVVAKDGEPGYLYFRTDGQIYRKTDSGSTTNWEILSDDGNWRYRSESSNFTAEIGEFIDVDTSGGAVTATLPASSGNAGKRIAIKNTDSNLCTVDGNAAETIDGATTLDIVEDDTVYLVSDGTNWLVVSHYKAPAYLGVQSALSTIGALGVPQGPGAGNSITIPANTPYMVHGSIEYSNSGGAANYQNCWAYLSTANASSTLITRQAGFPRAVSEFDSSPNIGNVVMMPVRVQYATATTIYINAQSDAGTAANQRYTTFLYAEKIT